LVSKDDEPSRVVKIYVDDELRYQIVPNRAVEFNPGTYRLRFETEGKLPVEHELVLGEAEKFKSVAISFANTPQPAAVASTVTPEPTKSVVPPPAPQARNRPIPLATYIFAGIGVAATANFAVWGLSSKALTSDLRNTCAPNCEQDNVDRAKTRALIADISLGVGVASLATATIWYLLRPSTSAPVEVNVGFLPKGGIATALSIKTF